MACDSLESPHYPTTPGITKQDRKGSLKSVFLTNIYVNKIFLSKSDPSISAKDKADIVSSSFLEI